jgi:hypothetical protein
VLTDHEAVDNPEKVVDLDAKWVSKMKTKRGLGLDPYSSRTKFFALFGWCDKFRKRSNCGYTYLDPRKNIPVRIR